MPGARNLHYAALLSDGHLKAPDELRALFAENGIDPDRPVVTTCGSGVTATHDVLALQRAGFPRVRLFPGSWSQWSSDPSRPVATGPTP